MNYLLIISIIIIGILGFKLYQKQKIDKTLLEEYQTQLICLKNSIQLNKENLNEIEKKLSDAEIKTNTEYQNLMFIREQIENAQASLSDARDEYQNLVNDRMKEVDQLMDEQRQKRQSELDETFKEKTSSLELQFNELVKQYNDLAENAKQVATQLIEESENKVQEYQSAEEQERERFESLRKPLFLYELEKQKKLYYTIQLPEEFREDIEFLLTTVAAKVQHPDIISKLVWAEYVKPYLDDTFKRIEIKAEPGIYKLTNLINGKCYIGKSTNVKTRIADHFKSSIGIKSIADQAVHHAILKDGFWNWTIEVVIYCDKDKLSELEKYYIDFFKSQEFGYNRNSGG